MLHERQQHRGHAARERGVFRLDQFEDEAGLERRHQHGGGRELTQLERHHLPPDVEQRHGLHIDVARLHPEAHGPETSGVGHAPVGEQGTLGRAGGPRGVDELRDVVGLHCPGRA